MNNFVELMNVENNYTYTENGAIALNSTLNACLDMFGCFGAFRDEAEDRVIDVFKKAFFEDKETAMRMLFYFRNIRGGQGVRRPFRVVITWLAQNYPEYVENNFDNIFLFGRCDDMLCLLDTQLMRKTVNYLMAKLKEDQQNMEKKQPVSLLAKWMPSENASSKQTKKYANIIINVSGMTPRNYRQTLSALRNYLDVTEVKMTNNRWNEIDFERVPGKASLNYADAFYKHEEDRYKQYLLDVAAGKTGVNAAALYPVDIAHRLMDDRRSYGKTNVMLYDAMWKALPNYFEGKNETGICVVDVSGSMYGLPMEVAISLGLYCADKCQGPYANKFITFSVCPEIQKVCGANIKEKIDNMSRAKWDMNTNIEAVFELILNTAVNNHCAPEEVPAKLYIISDMQFDFAIRDYEYYNCCGGKTQRKNKTFMSDMKARFAAAGYNMPALVYWNVRASECGMFQDTYAGENCCMVSGYSSSLFKSVIDGTEYVDETVTKVDEETGEVVEYTVQKQVLDPMTVMKKTVYDEKYDCVWWG